MQEPRHTLTKAAFEKKTPEVGKKLFSSHYVEIFQILENKPSKGMGVCRVSPALLQGLLLSSASQSPPEHLHPLRHFGKRLLL